MAEAGQPSRIVPSGDGDARLKSPNRSARERIVQAFSRFEDMVYVGLGLLLASGALVMLVDGAMNFGRSIFYGGLPAHIVATLDRLLLIVMIVELLYTVKVSFREHTLIPEPFLIVGMIAGTRRILVLTAELGTLLDRDQSAFRNAMIEIGLLTVMIVALVAALRMLRTPPERTGLRLHALGRGRSVAGGPGVIEAGRGGRHSLTSLVLKGFGDFIRALGRGGSRTSAQGGDRKSHAGEPPVTSPQRGAGG